MRGLDEIIKINKEAAKKYTAEHKCCGKCKERNALICDTLDILGRSGYGDPTKIVKGYCTYCEKSTLRQCTHNRIVCERCGRHQKER